MIGLRDFVDSDIGSIAIYANNIGSIAIYANNINVSRYMASRMPYPYTKDDAR
jgi:hypothetical protein